MTRLAEKTLASLTGAGWAPGRQVDVSHYDAAYAANGHELNARVREFLREFGGLSLSYAHFRNPARTDGCSFHVDEAAKWKPAWLRDYEQGVGRSVIPIGHAFSEHMLLVMTDQGRVYACLEDTLCLVGNDYVEALNALCEGRELECFELDEAKTEEPVSGLEQLEDESQQVLRAAGWYPGRRVDVTQEVSSLRRWGFRPTGETESFLEEFGFLTIEPPASENSAAGGGFTIVPSRVAQVLPQAHLAYYRAVLPGEDLVPVGTSAVGDIVLLMSTNGAMYGGIEDVREWLVRYGDTPIQAINVLCNQRPATRVI